MAGDAAGTLLTNRHIAAVLAEIADLLHIKGESPFKVDAYQRAAESIRRSSVDVAAAYEAGQRPELPGVGKSIASRIDELVSTGSVEYLEELREEVPPSLVAMLAIPGVGPRTVGEIWRTLGIATLTELAAAAREGRLRSIRGISARTEARIVAGIEELERRPPRRMLMGEARALADEVVELVETFEATISARVAGSIRRRTETVGDLDVLVETEHPDEVIAALASSAIVDRVGGHGGRGGADRVTVRLVEGTQLDVMIMPPGRLGSYLLHFTGSAEHNVRLRQRARESGWSLSEHGLVRLGEDEADDARGDEARGDEARGDAAASPAPVDAPESRVFAAEADLYRFLGLDYVEPELREDAGEIEAAAEHRLPRLVSRSDLRGDCHSHSDWSDGREPLELMVESARRLGHEYLVLTDHSRSLTIANGLTPERVEQQHRVIEEMNERFERELASGEAPATAHPHGFRLLHGCEMEITVDGQLDYEDDLLERFDVVLASLHVGRSQPRAQLMARYESAMRNEHVDVITHPSGRKIGRRADLDLDWEAFYRMAAETGTLLEINGSENRLDLDEHRARAASGAGCRFAIDSDAHDRTEWQNLEWGAAVARRAWIEPGQVVNTLPLEAFLRAINDMAGW